tara:strand:+ start:239 stop:745 length:507 start_codon:yes stop_codon:yes gene_type:complete
MVLVIIVIGVIGSMASIILYEGSVVFTSETNRQGFVSQSRTAFWNIMRNVQGQANPENFYFSDSKNIYTKNAVGEQKEFRIHDSGSLDLNLGTETYHSLSSDISVTGTVGFSYLINKTILLIPEIQVCPRKSLTKSILQGCRFYLKMVKTHSIWTHTYIQLILDLERK